LGRLRGSLGGGRGGAVFECLFLTGERLGSAETRGEQKKEAQDWLSTNNHVEHTSINPNKAAHIGHVRNACWATRWCESAACGPSGADSKLLDNTGVQVADVGDVCCHGKRLRPVWVEEPGRGNEVRLLRWDLLREGNELFCGEQERAAKLRGRLCVRLSKARAKMQR